MNGQVLGALCAFHICSLSYIKEPSLGHIVPCLVLIIAVRIAYDKK